MLEVILLTALVIAAVFVSYFFMFDKTPLKQKK
jgi:hypothetical protein